MTDKEKLLALLKDFNLEPVSGEHDDSGNFDYVTLEAKRGNVQGYSLFICDWTFNKDGSFDSVGIWE